MLPDPMPEKLRAVIDTNHIMSAILSTRGASSKLIDWMTKDYDYFTLLISEDIRREYDTVAGWLIPDTGQNEKRRILNILYDRAEFVMVFTITLFVPGWTIHGPRFLAA
jgi:predicted nucleic acid-binding protein